MIRPLVRSDRHAVAGLLRRTGAFTGVEIDVALELVDLWLDQGEGSGYVIRVDDTGGHVTGYVCFGPTPLTEGTFDLYWIAVDPDLQGRGIGQRLLQHAEAEVRSRGGRLLLIETSSQESYGGTTRFYERSGYALTARVPEFYKPGDDKLIYAKRVRD